MLKEPSDCASHLDKLRTLALHSRRHGVKQSLRLHRGWQGFVSKEAVARDGTSLQLQNSCGSLPLEKSPTYSHATIEMP